MEENVIAIDFSPGAMEERYELCVERISKFPSSLADQAARAYFGRIKELVLKLDEVRKGRKKDRTLNELLFDELREENYGASFLNPEYCLKRFGSERSAILCVWYSELRGIIPFIFEGRLKDVNAILETTIQIYNIFEDEQAIAGNDERTNAGSDAEIGIGGKQQANPCGNQHLNAGSDEHANAGAVERQMIVNKRITDTVYEYLYDYTDEFVEDYVYRDLCDTDSFAKNIVMHADLSDTGAESYLYSYGEWITEEEAGTARLMNQLPEETIVKMANAYTSGYLRGFTQTGKDVGIKETVVCYLPIGFERFMREAVKQLEAAGLKAVINRNPVHLINKKIRTNIKPGFYGASNKQCDYDHRDDICLFWGNKLMEHKLSALQNAYEANAAALNKHSGNACVEIFGLKAGEPVNKNCVKHYSAHQLKLNSEYSFRAHEAARKYMPDEETSFTIIAWPTPSIAENDVSGNIATAITGSIVPETAAGEATESRIHEAAADKTAASFVPETTAGEATGSRIHEAAADKKAASLGMANADSSAGLYREIFEEFIKINTLPIDRWELIQQNLIDALDKADYVEIIGQGANRTRLKVKLHELKDPKNETNFENCLADVNIPAGEVFTSPELKGTDGVLNAGYVYINGFLFKNLRLRFTNGRVSDYACDNFTDPGEGKKLIEKVIFGDRERLPLGEFAIGTNTIAYAAAKRYGIEDKMPVLIAEKTGPHFAVGDTCYSYEEDVETFNPDGKRIAAKDNECSAHRVNDPENAYFSVHTDITIPYEELGSITAVTRGGRIDIIRNGRFVLEGAEELNDALD